MQVGASLQASVLGENIPKQPEESVFGKEAPQNSCPERVTIAERQGASDEEDSEEKPTLSKTDSSGCFGINGPGDPSRR